MLFTRKCEILFLLMMVRIENLCVILSSVLCHSLFCLLHTPPANKVDMVVSFALSCGLLQVMMRMVYIA